AGKVQVTEGNQRLRAPDALPTWPAVRQHAAQQAVPFRQAPTHVPELPQRPREAQSELQPLLARHSIAGSIGLARALNPVQRRPKVGLLLLVAAVMRQLLGTEEPGFHPLRQRAVPRKVAVAPRGRFPGCMELLAAVLANRLQQAVAHAHEPLL